MRTETFGKNVLHLGNSYDIIDSLDYDAIVTDPPYDIIMKGGNTGLRRVYMLGVIDNKTDSGFDDNIFNSATNWVSFCSKAQIVRLIQKAEGMNLRWMLLTWNKTNPTPLTNGCYLPDTEYIIHAFDKLPDNEYKDKKRFKVFPVEKNNFDHPSVKPLAICDWIIKTTTFKDSIVIDPFMGTGSIGLSCNNLDRTFIGIEQNEKYFDIACRRFDKLSNKSLDDIFN